MPVFSLRRSAIATAIVMSAAFLVLAPASAATAASCPTQAQVKAQVAALVTQLRSDVPSVTTRAALRAALLESRRALRGAKAKTPAQRRGLGRQISALAKQLGDVHTAVHRRAILTQIHALQEQKERGGLTAAERARLKADNAALRKAVVAKLDNAAEIRSITSKFRAIHRSFTC